MNTDGVFIFNDKEDPEKATENIKWMVGGRVGSLLLVVLALFLACSLCGLAFYYGTHKSNLLVQENVSAGQSSVIEEMDRAVASIPNLLKTFSLLLVIPPLGAFVSIMWIGAWLFERKTDRATANFFFNRRVKACREKLQSLCHEGEHAHSIVQVGAPAIQCAPHGFNLALASLFLISIVGIATVAALTATGPYLTEEYGLYLIFVAIPVIGAAIQLIFRPNIFRATYIVAFIALTHFLAFCINPVIGMFAVTWPPAVIAALSLLAVFVFQCISSFRERAILISTKGLRLIEFSGTHIEEVVPCFIPNEVKVGRASSGPSLSFDTPEGKPMVLVPTIEKVLAFSTLTLGAGLDIKITGNDDIRSPFQEAIKEPLRFSLSGALAAACFFVGLPVMRLSLYLGLCTIVAIAPFFGKDPKGLDVMIHACHKVLKTIPREPVSLCFLWMAHNGKCEYDLADKQMEELQTLKDELRIPELWDVGQVGRLFSTIKKEYDKRKELFDREPAGWEPRKEGRRDFIIGAGIAAEKISSLGIVSLDHHVSKLLIKSHQAEPSAPGPTIMLAYYLYSKTDFAVTGLSSVPRSPKETSSRFEYSQEGIEHKLRTFESAFDKLKKMLVNQEEQPNWRGLLPKIEDTLPLQYRSHFLRQLLRAQLRGDDRKQWLPAFSLIKGKRFIPAPPKSCDDTAMTRLVLNPPEEISKVIASWPELTKVKPAITTPLCTCDEKTFYDFYKKVENYKIVTGLYGAEAQKARALGLWPPYQPVK